VDYVKINTMTAGRAQELLRAALGEGARFRPGQLEAILALVDDQARVLVVQRTGWGKSIVYLIATALLRERGQGPTILISPLLALMRDQLRMAELLGVRAGTLNSSNTADWQEVEQALAADELDLLLISPERLANQHFRTDTLRSIPRALGLFVVDEAHCISDWGHEFRSDYRRIRVLVDALPKSVPLLATTATANDRVIDDIAEQLGENLKVIRGPLERESLHLQVVKLDSQAERLAWLSSYIPSQQGSGIVYTLTVRDARRVSEWLATRGIDAPAYTGRHSSEDRLELERRLRTNELKALVATVALGMGFDKPDLSFVVHFQRPPSPIAYYQQIGRAGRALDRAEVILLAGSEDDEIAAFFTDAAFPTEEELRSILSALEKVEDASESELLKDLNIKSSALKKDLKILEVESAIAKADGHYARTPTPWIPDSDRIEAVTGVRVRERERMAELVETDDCLMQLLREELDDPDAEPCGRCANCVGAFAPEAIDPDELHAALGFLRHNYRSIAPRKQWPAKMEERPYRIPTEQQLLEGRALCLYGDPGWGQLVRSGKYEDGRFDDLLVDAVADMLQNQWRTEVMPTWVTSVPSRRAPELVDGFARRLAYRLRLPYRKALEKTENTPPQKDMQNSYHQARNALDSFAAIPESVIADPVLLVDDMVDSGWSLTVCGVLLAEAGSGPVLPVALADSSAGSGE
jgi:ATP-dependent DNA helicase RecQ